jgi:oligopeptide transport system substrate-binding protein
LTLFLVSQTELASERSTVFNKTFNPAMKTKRNLLLIILLCPLLSGCGRPETAVERGVRDQILYIGNLAEPEDLDPQTTADFYAWRINSALHEPLLSSDPGSLAARPGLAKEWSISEDRKIYTFLLRENARFSNGDPVLAEHLVASIKRALNPAIAFPYLIDLSHVEGALDYHSRKTGDFSTVGVKALGPRTLEVRLNRPLPYAQLLFQMPYWAPLHIPTLEKFNALERTGMPWTRPGNYVSNGPYQLKSWKVNQVIVVEKNPHYWGHEDVGLREIHFFPVGDRATEERMFRAGQLHATLRMPRSAIPDYRQNRPDVLRSVQTLTIRHVILNCEKPPFNDPRVRRALALALDRPAMVKALQAHDAPAYNMIPAGAGNYTSASQLKEDLASARESLRAAGFPGGAGFPKVTMLFSQTVDLSVMEMLQSMWKKNLNIDVELQAQEWKVVLGAYDLGDFQIGHLGWGGENDPYSYHDLFASGNPNNRSRWSNATFDRLRDLSLQEHDPARRFPILQQMDEILIEELPLIPLYFETINQAVHPSVHGWATNALEFQDWRSIRLRSP